MITEDLMELKLPELSFDFERDSINENMCIRYFAQGDRFPSFLFLIRYNEYMYQIRYEIFERSKAVQSFGSFNLDFGFNSL